MVKMMAKLMKISNTAEFNQELQYHISAKLPHEDYEITHIIDRLSIEKVFRQVINQLEEVVA